MPQMRRSVLCIEPHVDVCSMLKTLLLMYGFEADSAATIAEATGKARDGYFCLYIVDDGYRDGTNVNLIKRLRALTPQVPVLVFSTLDIESARVDAIRAGARDYLIKPSDLDDLIGAVTRLCGETAVSASGSAV